MSHLWEAHHPYYCNEGNYYAPGMDQPFQEYESWADFIDEEGDGDMDYNLLFRFDWEKKSDDNEQEHDLLKLFWMGQRKGLYRWTTIQITDDDEPAVKEWLTIRWQYLMRLWEGIAHSPQENVSE
jgi:hypothetical protein